MLAAGRCYHLVDERDSKFLIDLDVAFGDILIIISVFRISDPMQVIALVYCLHQHRDIINALRPFGDYIN